MNKKIILCSIILITSTHATASRDEFDPVFKRPAPVIHSLTKVAAGALSLMAGNYLWTEEDIISSERVSAEGFMMIGHTLVMDGVMGLCHWGYDRYMQVFHQKNHKKIYLSRNKYTQQPRTEKEEQGDDLRWNKVTTIGQSLSGIISNIIMTPLLLQTSYDVFSHDSSFTTKAMFPVACAISASLTAYYARRTYNAYHAKEHIQGEPPLLTFLTSINQGFAASQIKESFGLTYSFMRVVNVDHCPRIPHTLIVTKMPDIEVMDSDSIAKLIPLIDYYIECREPIRGSMIGTHFSELVGFHGEFKALSSLLQMSRNGISLFASRPQITIESAPPSVDDIPSKLKKSATHRKNPTEIQPNRLMTIKSSPTSSHTHFIGTGIADTTSLKPYAIGKPEKLKRRGSPNLGAGQNNIASVFTQNTAEIQDEMPVRAQGLKAIAEYRNFNAVKIKHINTLLRDVCNFVQGEINPVKGQGSWHALTFNHSGQRIKIKYEVPHGVDSGVYKGFKLKRVLNAIETAYMYGWNETGIKSYLDARGMSSFYTVPDHLIHILWRPKDL